MNTEVIQAADVADFFIDICKGAKYPMTNLRLNKMLYFAQGWYLATYGKPLFNERIQAWENGPVVPSIYHTFKCYRSSSIRKVDNPEYMANIENTQIGEFLLDVCNNYEDKPTRGLVAETHADGTPWSDVYDGTRYKDIPQSLIQRYFSDLPPMKRFDIHDLKNIPIVDAAGNPVR